MASTEVAPAPPADTPAHDEGHGHVTNTGLSNEKLAMWAFLGSECLLFGALISTYFLYRGRSRSGPTPESRWISVHPSSRASRGN